MLMLHVAFPLALAAQSNPHVVLDSAKQLFLDDWLIESKSNVTRRIHEAGKSPANPVLWPTEEWEGKTAVVYGSVMRDGRKWKMWYHGGGGVSYAESTDGIDWKKPKLDLVTIDGQKTNVIIQRGADEGQPGALPWFYEVFGVHKDDDPRAPYKLGYLSIQRDYDGPGGDPFHGGQRRGLGVASSADGIHFGSVEPWATEAIVDGATHWMLDSARGKYVLYGRTKHISDEIRAAWGDHEWFGKHWGRAVARVESDDFITWDNTDPLKAPVVMAAGPSDQPCDEIYSMLVFPYESVYIGLVQMFHNHPDSSLLDIQLAVSRDTVNFERVGNRATFIPVGGVGEWDRYNNSLANNPPIEVGEELRFYYGGRTYRHGPYDGPDNGEPGGGIGFATIQRDRFVSLEASFDGGEIVTRPMVLEGTELHLNATSDFGEIAVEALDTDGNVVATSKPIHQDSLDITVPWDGDDPFGSNEPVRLRVRLKNARLYALWCEKN